jgi:hypothetical protein
MTPDLVLTLSLRTSVPEDPHGDQIVGCLSDERGEKHEFSGWLGLLTLAHQPAHSRRPLVSSELRSPPHGPAPPACAPAQPLQVIPARVIVGKPRQQLPKGARVVPARHRRHPANVT